MKYELRLDLLKPEEWIDSEDAPAPPGIGITVRGPISTLLAAEGARGVLDYVVLTVVILWPSVIAAAQDAAKEVLKESLKVWLVDFITKHLAACPRINGKEPKDRVDVERIVSEEIEIGKND